MLFPHFVSRSMSGALALGIACLGFAATAAAQDSYAQRPYRPISPTMESQTITLTGKDLTLDQLVAIARYGAKVTVSAEAKQRNADRYGILMQSSAEGMAVYRLNRQAGAGREIETFKGDPMTPENKKYLEERELNQYRNGFRSGFGPEVSQEEDTRAMIAVRANASTYAASSPPILQMMVDLLNNRIAPIVRTRGSVGEADLSQIGNLKAVMVGSGDAYYRGVRMPAAEALQKAGLKPVQPFGADNDTLDVTNSYATGLAALLAYDGRGVLEWADLSHAMVMNGMNGSISPLSSVVQAARPFPWLNWDAARVLDMIKGGYLFRDEKRIIQDPESLRASSIRQASAWQAWATLRDDVTMQMNSSDNNPAVQEAKPSDSWELDSPFLKQFYVKGGKNSNGKSGYVFSNANWDPYPMANSIEYFSMALANLDIAIMLRQAKFASTFFTVDRAQDVIKDLQGGGGGGSSKHDVYQHIQALMMPLSPEGYSTDIQQVEELDAQTVLKAERGRELVEESRQLIGYELITAAMWMDVRKAQDQTRTFGNAPTAALAAFRKVLPLQRQGVTMPDLPAGTIAYNFLRDNPASNFYPSGPAMPPGPMILTDKGRKR